uniref:Uncharacterized protein n=1 Tax=Rhizophora mucronata TaxID=61149 RepID=A0A2P2N1Q9_RHIMU
MSLQRVDKQKPSGYKGSQKLLVEKKGEQAKCWNTTNSPGTHSQLTIFHVLHTNIT